jgi:hypothetical protein
MGTEASHLDDDEPVSMTVQECTVWACLVAVVVSSGAYLGLMVVHLLSRPVAEISWVRPMLWSMGVAVAGSVLLAIVFAAITTRRGGCSPTDGGEVISDVRDQEISRLGSRASMGALSTGLGGALILIMLDAHPFWTGNLLFLFGAAAAILATTTKIRLYRRGF